MSGGVGCVAGRWLGGVTPTGYESESVERVTVDGKRKKVCKLKLIPDEAETVKLIFDLFLENCSLTKTEAELLKRDRKTKNGKGFTRFALKGILQNPVYVIADEEADRRERMRRAKQIANNDSQKLTDFEETGSLLAGDSLPKLSTTRKGQGRPCSRAVSRMWWRIVVRRSLCIRSNC